MLASTAGSAAEAVAGFERASVEWKLDGIRIQIHRREDEVAIFTRNGNDLTHALPGIVAAARGLPVRQAVLDGEALWLREELVLRLAAARVMARPALANLNPGGTVDSFNYTVNFQNPNLDPTRATALDAAIEWYFSNNSLLSLAVFWKDIESFPIRQSRTGTFASTGLPRSVIAPTSPRSPRAPTPSPPDRARCPARAPTPDPARRRRAR